MDADCYRTGWRVIALGCFLAAFFSSPFLTSFLGLDSFFAATFFDPVSVISACVHRLAQPLRFSLQLPQSQTCARSSKHSRLISLGNQCRKCNTGIAQAGIFNYAKNRAVVVNDNRFQPTADDTRKMVVFFDFTTGNVNEVPAVQREKNLNNFRFPLDSATRQVV